MTIVSENTSQTRFRGAPNKNQFEQQHEFHLSQDSKSTKYQRENSQNQKSSSNNASNKSISSEYNNKKETKYDQ